MKDTIKQLLREALGVPDNITNVGVEVYNKVLNYLNQQPTDILMTDIPNKIKITGNHEVILTNKKRKRVDLLNEDDEIFDFKI